MPETTTTAIPISRRRRRILVATTAIVAAAAAAVIVVRVGKPQPIVLAQASQRPLEARLSDASADRWRPYAGPRASGPAREEVRVDTLTTLQKRGDWRRLADAYLLSGEPARAADALAKAPPSADVESDRAALALQEHDPRGAVEHAARALALAPGHAQAAWNRTLALVELGLVRSAAIRFDLIARAGERGWSDEAFKRAIALRTAYQRLERERIEREHARAAEAGAAPTQAHAGAAKASAAAVDAAKASAAAVDAEERRLRELARRSPADGERAAVEAADDARRSLADPHDSVRRYLLVAAEAARAQSRDAVADAYVDEARLLVPGGD